MIQTPLMQDLGRGLAGRCLRCGDGALFTKYLKVTDRCAVCGEEFHHHRSDDFPAYIVIFLLGHIMVPLAFWIDDRFAPSTLLLLTIVLPLTVLLCLLMLPPVKGAIVALQWRNGMHGFAKREK